MTSLRKNRILRGFDRARDYDRHARVQHEVAEKLAARIATMPLPQGYPGLELGCGTGFLTQAILRSHPVLELLATDIAPGMLDRARARLATQPGVRLDVMDAECPSDSANSGHALIASSLAFQWLQDPASAIAGWYARLAPGGWLAIATLEKGSFAEWREALDAAGIGGATRDYPTADALAAKLPADALPDCWRETIVETFPDSRRFLDSLRAIGAATAWEGHATPAMLRRALAAFEQAGTQISYRIAFVIVQRPA